VATSLDSLAHVRQSLGRAAEAEPLYVQALQMYQRLFKDGHPHIVIFMFHLADCLDDLGRGDEAIARRREALAVQRRLVPPDSPPLAWPLAQLGFALVKAGTPSAAVEAEPILRECLAIRQNALPDGHAQQWLRFTTMSLLGGALAGQAKFTEAEPLLLDGYNGMKDDPRVPPPGPATGGADRKREALERIVKLYEAWDAGDPGQGYAEKAAEWRAGLEQPDAPPPDADNPGPSP
jgi:tetratricopeptide (TPR) repeat protein